MQNKVCCFGELMVRLSPPEGADWSTHPSMPFCIGRAELNVATALANWNTSVSYVTALPDNDLSVQFVGFDLKNATAIQKAYKHS